MDMSKLEEIRNRHLKHSKMGGVERSDDGGWITINGTHVMVDKDGNLTGPVGEKIASSGGRAKKSGSSEKSGSANSKAKRPKLEKTLRANPEKPKKPSHKACEKAIDKAVEDIGGSVFEAFTNNDTEYEVEGKVSIEQFSAVLNNALREKGFKTQNWTKTGKASDKASASFTIESNKYWQGVDVSITKGESSFPGKSYFDVEIMEFN